jgi:predicted transcriptional regulator
MRTVRMTLNEDLVRAVDRASRRLGTTRSEFARRALRDALARQSIVEQERKHREGYARRPVTADEFSVWELEWAWGNEQITAQAAGTSSRRRTGNARS